MAQENVKFLLRIWLLLLYFFSSAFGSNNTQDNIQDAYGDGSSSPTQSACTNCTVCPSTCQSPPLPPPPPSGGYQSYGVPPPTGYVNCPPAQPVMPCCPQYTNYGPPPPYNYYSGSSTLLPFIKLFAFEWSSAILVLFIHYVVSV